SSVVRYGASGVAEHRNGSRLPNAAPRNVYRTHDGGWVVISALTDRAVQRLLEAMSASTPENLRRFGSAAARAANANTLDGFVADWVQTQERDALVELLAAARIPVSAVNDMAAVFDDPHIR